MANVLITRFSALGDVAISVPLLKAVAAEYPDDHFLVATQPFMAALFNELPDNLQVLSVDLRGTYRGIGGMLKLYNTLRPRHIDVVCDLHGVLRTNLLDLLFRLKRPVHRVTKERAARRRLTRRRNKVLAPLTPTMERYRQVLGKAGFVVTDEAMRKTLPSHQCYVADVQERFGPKEGVWLGIAPFAKHAGKCYPLEKMIEVVAHFAGRRDCKVFLFGGGTAETAVMNDWKTRFPDLVLPVIGQLLDDIQLMNCLDVLLTMDSANMHLGVLANTRVLSIWGATHPLAGFAAWNQSAANRLQVDLPCRPCSIYGKKPCYRKDLACLNTLTPQHVIAFIEKNLPS